jgi:hypothetical protein
MTDAGDEPDSGGFTLEVTRFEPTLCTDESPIESLADLDAAIDEHGDVQDVVFGLAADEGAGGAFYLFVSGDRAWVHLTAGPCLTARVHARPERDAPVLFRLDTGETRTVPADQTVSREQGVTALRHWFRTEQPWPDLEWVPA